ncbi:hypothetical protein KO361_04950 [Candidatus Woesearchaeota archaeon]|nr:hypothetical protein [Candidatus Woesearchaeota archaeon]
MEDKEIMDLKKELILVFSSFINNPNSDEIKEKAKKIDEQYSGLLSYSQLSSNEILSKIMLEALGNVSLICEYGMYDEDHIAFSKKKIESRIKKILKTLKEDYM